MHIYVLARGILKGMREWEEFMSSQYFPMDMKIKGKKVRHLAQLQVRPIKLYEVVCPEGSENKVLSMIKGQKKEQEVGKIGKWLKRIRKFVGLDEPSQDWKPCILPPNVGVTTYVLGTKKDKLNWKALPDANSALKKGTPHEML